MELTESNWDDILNLNLKSTMLCSQAVVPSMMERKRGAIVNLSSIAGRTGGGPGAIAYSVSKGRSDDIHINHWRKNWPRMESRQCRVTGVIDTPFHEVFSTAEMMRGFVSAIPLGRIGTSMEIATYYSVSLLQTRLVSSSAKTIEINGGQLNALNLLTVCRPTKVTVTSL